MANGKTTLRKTLVVRVFGIWTAGGARDGVDVSW
jgi:hypothetical protein